MSYTSEQLRTLKGRVLTGNNPMPETQAAIYDAFAAALEELDKTQVKLIMAEIYVKEVNRDLAASVVKSQELEAENSKLRSALEIVHFKREPWQ